MDFLDQRVCVTGGTKGIGKAIVKRFLDGGAQVITAARSDAPDFDKRGLLVKADLSRLEGVQILADAVLERLGGIDILVHNVGGASVIKEVPELTEEDWQSVLSANLFPAIRLNKALLSKMIGSGKGVIIHITALQGYRPLDKSLAYGVAKAALRMYSKGLANEISQFGVRVVSVCPGYIDTSHKEGKLKPVQRSGTVIDQSIQRQMNNIPLGRHGRPEEVAELIAFIASDKSLFINGAEYVIDGGSFPGI